MGKRHLFKVLLDLFVLQGAADVYIVDDPDFLHFWDQADVLGDGRLLLVLGCKEVVLLELAQVVVGLLNGIVVPHFHHFEELN